ncbi:MAG: hypothetical protein U1E05_03175 [Patescibacteria group bacterium]|nr:hypothetical protein [Patescibacteria group bacterium]
MATFFTQPISRLPAAGFVLLALLSVLGCGSGQSVYPVQGKIVYEDGAPATDLKGFTVTFESIEHAATAERSGIGGWGEVRADGTFTIGTYKPADGAVPGKHRVAVSPEPQLGDGGAPRFVIPLRYACVDTSELSAEVHRGKNTVELTISRD